MLSENPTFVTQNVNSYLKNRNNNVLYYYKLVNRLELLNSMYIINEDFC